MSLRLTLLATLTVMLGCGCAREHDAHRVNVQRETLVPAVTTHVLSAGAEPDGETSRVRVARHADGSERIEGETLLRGSDGRSWRIVEQAVLEDSGRLARARIRLADDGRAGAYVREVVLDASGGVWTVADARGTVAGRMSRQYPWAYASLLGDVDPALQTSTPVAAWIALRAARSSDAVWLVDTRAGAHEVLADQVVIGDGARAWVVLGHQVVAADSEFVLQLPLRSIRGEPGAGLAAAACPSEAPSLAPM